MPGQGDPSAHGPGLGVGPHPLTALHFAAAELAAGLGVDERPLACLHLQVSVIGQALLGLFSAFGEEGHNPQTLGPVARTPHPPSATSHWQNWDRKRAEPPSSLPSGGVPRQSRKKGGRLRGRGSDRCRPAEPVHTHPRVPPLPLLAQVHQLGHVVAQLDLHHLARGIRIPVSRTSQRQKTALEKRTPRQPRPPLHPRLAERSHRAFLRQSVKTFSLSLLAPAEPAQSGRRSVLVGQDLGSHPGAKVQDIKHSLKAPARWDCVVPPGGAPSPSSPGPAHRKWLSTVSFVACLGSPVMNRVRLTCRSNTPKKKVTSMRQSQVFGPRFLGLAEPWPVAQHLHGASSQLHPDHVQSDSTSLRCVTGDRESTQRGEATQTGSHSRSGGDPGLEPSSRNCLLHQAVGCNEGGGCSQSERPGSHLESVMTSPISHTPKG